MTLTRPTDPTLRPPRITEAKFASILSAHHSPALSQAGGIWSALTAGGVDPSFALGHFLVESIYGTSGYATHTHSWGNILWDAAWTPDRPKWSSGTGYTYAVYDSFGESATDYVEYVRRYAVTPDDHYGDLCDTIDKCTARWTGKLRTDPEHILYVTTLIAAVNDEYEFVPGTFSEEGDKMIFAGKAGIKTDTRYPVANGTLLYRGTNGDVLKVASFTSSPTSCRFLGPVGQPWSDATWAWGAIIVGTSMADVNGTIVYIKDPKKSLVTTPLLTARAPEGVDRA